MHFLLSLWNPWLHSTIGKLYRIILPSRWLHQNISTSSIIINISMPLSRILIPTLLCIFPHLLRIQRGIKFFYYCNLSLLGPAYKCFWIFEKFCSNTSFNSSCSFLALRILPLYSFRLLTVAIRFGGVSLSLHPFKSSSLRCEVSSILFCTINLCFLLVFPTCWNTNHY